MTCPETTLESALESLGLLEYVENFRREKVDFESLVIGLAISCANGTMSRIVCYTDPHVCATLTHMCVLH